MNLLKSYLRQKTSYYKNYYYRNTFYSYNFKEHYSELNLLNFYNTQTQIIFKGKVFFGTSISEVEKLIGKSHFQFEDEDIYGYITTYYKNKVQSLKNKSQLHFYNNRFFFGVQSFPYLTKQEKSDLFDLIKIKYQIPLSLTLPYAIKDQDRNILLVRDNVGLVLEYYSGNKMLINSVLEAFEKASENIILKQEEARKYIMSNI